jgi:hypothetical protein
METAYQCSMFKKRKKRRILGSPARRNQSNRSEEALTGRAQVIECALLTASRPQDRACHLPTQLRTLKGQGSPPVPPGAHAPFGAQPATNVRRRKSETPLLGNEHRPTTISERREGMASPRAQWLRACPLTHPVSLYRNQNSAVLAYGPSGGGAWGRAERAASGAGTAFRLWGSGAPFQRRQLGESWCNYRESRTQSDWRESAGVFRGSAKPAAQDHAYKAMSSAVKIDLCCDRPLKEKGD